MPTHSRMRENGGATVVQGTTMLYTATCGAYSHPLPTRYADVIGVLYLRVKAAQVVADNGSEIRAGRQQFVCSLIHISNEMELCLGF
jgi:hypothetical protein